MKVPFYRPHIEIEKQLLHHFFLNHENDNEYISLFEKAFASYFSFDNVLSVNSGSIALYLALLTLGIKPQDEVITSTATCPSVFNIVEHIKARLVLADIEEHTLNIDPKSIEKNISSKTSAIIVPHYAGHMADMVTIKALADKYNVFLIEDAARAQGANYKNIPSGHFGKCAVFSFSPTKNMCAAEGGMLIGDKDFIDQARKHCFFKLTDESYDTLQLEFRMNALTSLLGHHQLQKFKSDQQQREDIANRYNQAFSEIKSLHLPITLPGYKNAWHQYTLRIDSKKISPHKLIKELRKNNIEASPDYIANHRLSYYQKKYGFNDDRFPIAIRENEKMICLPIFAGLKIDQVEHVIKTILFFMKDS